MGSERRENEHGRGSNDCQPHLPWRFSSYQQRLALLNNGGPIRLKTDSGEMDYLPALTYIEPAALFK